MKYSWKHDQSLSQAGRSGPSHSVTNGSDAARDAPDTGSLAGSPRSLTRQLSSHRGRRSDVANFGPRHDRVQTSAGLHTKSRRTHITERQERRIDNDRLCALQATEQDHDYNAEVQFTTRNFYMFKISHFDP